MRRRVWSAEEIRDILVATHQASSLSAAVVSGQEDESARALRAYCQGFKAALFSLTVAFGISPFTGDLEHGALEQ